MNESPDGKDTLTGIGIAVVWSVITFSPLVGLWYAFQNESFWNGIASLVIPLYGLIYSAVNLLG